MIAVTASLSVAALIYGLTVPLLSLILERQGVDHTLIGLSTATQSLAVFGAAPLVPRLMRFPGPAWLMLWSIIASIILLLLLPAFPNVYAWFPLRFMLGLAWSVVWIAGEAWINQAAQDHVRGRVLALFAMAVTGGFALGPLILIASGSDGWAPFIVAAAIMAVAAIPLFLILSQATLLEGQRSTSLHRYLLLAPVPMLLHACFASADGILLTFTPIYGLRLGLGEAYSLTLITLMGAGGIALQLPVGWLADHMNRMLLTAIMVVVITLGAISMPLVIAHSPWNWMFMFLFGGALGSLYTLGLVLMGQRFKGADLVAASSVFGIMWSTGAIVGPPIGGLGMEYIGTHGMPIALALIFLAVSPFPIVSYFRSRRTTTDVLGTRQ
ncbi:MAG: MFS transporter [Gammaproteobacteria bacterium]|nr:MFS transporter [Gammaproteobacteria bacterium]